MGHLIQCCLAGETGDLPAAFADDHVTVRTDACLQRCGVCYDGPFAVVDGELVEGDSPADLLARVRAEVET